MTITALPTPPSPSDSPAVFNAKAFDLLGALPTFVTEANGLEAENAAAASAAATAAANAVLASKLDTANPSYTGTLTGGTGVVNIGAGQVVKDASGNFGLGVTPSGWNSNVKAFQYGLVGSLACRVSGEGSYLSSNVYYSGDPALSASGGVYMYSAAATSYSQSDGAHKWYTAPSGTAGNPISFTQVMALNASGVLTLTPTISQAALFNYSGGAYTTWQHSGTSLGDIGAANQVIGGGSSADFAISSRSGSLVLGTANGVERARIDASGNLLVGATSSSFSSRQEITQDGSAPVAMFRKNNADTGSAINIWHGGASGGTTATGINFLRADSSTVGSIGFNGTTISYNTSSDARLKENISNANNGSALIDQIQVRQFDWKSDGSHQRYGFVAQELDAVYPEAVSKPADSDEMMAVDYSKLVPLLVQEIQSLRARLAAAGI